MKTILVPIDFSDATPLLLSAAVSFARAHDSRLVLVHIVHPPLIATAYGLSPEEAGTQIEEEKERARGTLARHAGLLRSQGMEVFTELREGACVPSILAVADEQAADLLVVGSHGHGALYNLLVGSTAQGLLKAARCPVLIVPAKYRNNRPSEELADSRAIPHFSSTGVKTPGNAHGLRKTVKRGTDRKPPKARK